MPLAAYLDEITHDPLIGCALLAERNFKNVCLRSLWHHEVGDTSDAACAQIMGALVKHNLQVVMVATSCGNASSSYDKEYKRFERALLIASFFRARFIRVYAGIEPNDWSRAEQWLDWVQARCAELHIEPLIELMGGSLGFELEDVERLTRLKFGVIYDPAALIVCRRHDPIVYWNLLQHQIAAVDLHDCKIGFGFCPLGHGDGNWTTLRPMLRGGERWLFLEPGLGDNYGGYYGLHRTFDLASTEAKAFLGDLYDGSIRTQPAAEQPTEYGPASRRKQ